jgi:hypothetical protein
VKKTKNANDQSEAKDREVLEAEATLKPEYKTAPRSAKKETRVYELRCRRPASISRTWVANVVTYAEKLGRSRAQNVACDRVKNASNEYTLPWESTQRSGKAMLIFWRQKRCWEGARPLLLVTFRPYG